MNRSKGKFVVGLLLTAALIHVAFHFSETPPRTPTIPLIQPQSALRSSGEDPSDAPLKAHTLQTALTRARHAITPISGREAELEPNKGARYFAANPRQQLTARFLDSGARIESGRRGAWQAALSFSNTRPVLNGDRIEYRHSGGVTEWYRNDAVGIEHGFEIEQAAQTNRLRLTVAVQGAIPTQTGSDAITFIDSATREPILRYDHLKVIDASGRQLAAVFEAHPTGFAINVDTGGASYPITVDPLITSLEATFEPAFKGDGAATDAFGLAAALEGDTALIGAPNDDTTSGINAGSVYVFTRAGSTWSLQTKLFASDGSLGDSFGNAIALHGNVCIIGARATGAAYIFERTLSRWSEQAKLTSAETEPDDFFGAAVAIHNDTAIVGAFRDDDESGLVNAGSAYVFSRAETGWVQQAKLKSPTVQAEAYFGWDVALWEDTAAIGSPYSAPAGADIFTRTGTNWSFATHLSVTDSGNLGWLGYAVAIHHDTIVLGAPSDDLNGNDLGSAYVFVGSGANWTRQAKLIASDGATQDNFGSPLAIYNDTIVVSAPAKDSTFNNTGAAYIFTRTNNVWSQRLKLQNPDPAVDSGFSGVAISSDTILGAAPGEITLAGPRAGAAWAFVRNGNSWTLQSRLDAGDGGGADYFAASVAIRGDTAMVGMPNDDTPAGRDTGAAYVFARTGTFWNFQARLNQNAATTGDQFGFAVALSEDAALIGSPEALRPTGAFEGSAYIFRRNGAAWSQQAKLIASDRAMADGFGASVALNNNTALVGVPSDNGKFGADSGSVHVFVWTGTNWIFQAKLEANAGIASDRFGASVSLDQETALIGSPGYEGTQGTDVGAAFVFVRSGTNWTQQTRLNPIGVAAEDAFGSAVALSGETALVGAPRDDSGVTLDVGSAYVFTRNGAVWTQQTKLNPAGGAANELFGNAVALDGNIAAIGVPFRTEGRVVVYSRNGSTWTEQPG
jgi:hypothetical protein